MADTASLFSDTTTLYDVPILTDTSGTLVPLEECFAILFINHDHFKAEPDQLTRAGLPSIYDRTDNPSGSKSALAKINLKKQRLQVQFPKQSIQHATIDRQENVTTVQQVQQFTLNKRSSVGRMMTMFDSLETELVGVRTRRIMDVALAVLFKSTDVRNPKLYYPASSVLLIPNWAVSKERGMAISDAQWATISFLSPATSVSTESKQDAEKRYLASLTYKETDADVLQRLFIPSEEDESTLMRLLQHLESRGIIWSKAGLATRPSIKNSDPSKRLEYVVLGLFPKPFYNRCKVYHSNGKAMPSDLDEGGKSKHSPLITAVCNDTPSSNGKNGSASSSSEDFLAGWTIRLAVAEPYRTGRALQDAPVAGISGAAIY